MEPSTLFLWGFAGVLAAEVCPLWKSARAGQAMPKKFRRASYWFVWLSMAVFGGLLAVASRTESPLIAMYVGVVAPLLVDRWKATPPSVGEE